MYILGISCYYHDSAVCLIRNGEIINAIQEERLTRTKHDNKFPKNSIIEILNKNNLSLSQINKIVFYEKPFLKFERLIETYLSFAPKGISSFLKVIPIWIKDKIFQKISIFNELRAIDFNFCDPNKIYFSEHHLSHAASAFYASPFLDAAILTIDAVGEWATSSIAIGSGNKIEIKEEINFPHSIGLLYSSFTYFCGFEVNSGEYKLMGLAPYGKPIFKEKILKNLIFIKQDGSFRLNMKYFNYCTGFTMTNKNFDNLFNSKPRGKNDKINQFHMDLASSIQSVTEDIIILICKHIKNKYKSKNLCLAGGVALNCVANGKIINEKIFDRIWIQPAAGDAGGALGAALAYWFLELKNNRIISEKNIDDMMKGSLLGFSESRTEMKKFFDNNAIEYEELNFNTMINYVAEYLSTGKAVAWYQNKMEFGPRALGSRSILADPRNPNMQKELNLSVKFRENFRPFAPIILKNKLNDWFNLKQDSPYMGIVSQIKDDKKIKVDNLHLDGLKNINVSRSVVPAITHVDYSSRIQTVDGKFNPEIYSLLLKFFEITNVPILVNTSFNLSNEPIVCTVTDAYKTFMTSGLKLLVCGNFIIRKKN
jgi:carbamoyltransferase